jgi:hypothetical protein
MVQANRRWGKGGRAIQNDNGGFQYFGYPDEPFVLAKDIAQVFYVKDMSSTPRK